MYLTQGLHRSLRSQPGHIATIFGERQRTYREFADRVARLAGFGLISTLCETSFWPSPLVGSSRSEQRAKLTGLS